VKINTEPISVYSFIPEPKPPTDKHLLDPIGASELYLVDGRYKDFEEYDNYEKSDISKKPAALYEFPDGFSGLFSAQTIIDFHANNPDSPLDVTNPEHAESIALSLHAGSPYRDYALSNLALYNLYDGNYQEANRLLHLIEDKTLATDVLTKIITEETKAQVLTPSQDDELRNELRRVTIEVLSELEDLSKANILGRAAILLNDSGLEAMAVDSGKVHFSAPVDGALETVNSRRKSRDPKDDAKRIDMAELLES